MPITLIDNKNGKQERYSGIFTLNANKWFLPTGILPSNVIAAYQFEGAVNEASALLNQNNPGTLALAKTGSDVTWNQSNGFNIPGALQKGLSQAGIASYISVAVKFSGLTAGNTAAGLVAPANGYLLMAKGYRNNIIYMNAPTFSVAESNGQPVYWASSFIGEGVVTYMRNAYAIYANGANQAISNAEWNTGDDFYGVTIGHGGRKYSQMSQPPVFQAINIQAVAFYNNTLTPAQVVELTNSMNAL